MAHSTDTRGHEAGENENDEIHVFADGAANNSQKKRQRRKVNERVSIACTMCRRQHLRCDATMPSCSRCRSLNKTCVYTDIRRRRRNLGSQDASIRSRPLDEGADLLGGVHVVDEPASEAGPSQDRHQEIEAVLAASSHDACPYDVPGNVRDLHAPARGNILPYEQLRDVSLLPEGPTHLDSSTPSASSSLLTSRPLDGFYTYFFPAHPFVLPRTQFTQHFDAIPDSLSELLFIMTLIGSLYIHDEQSYRFRLDAERIPDKTLPSTGFTVQALMLLSLCLEWRGENSRAADMLERAKTTALSIGMNRKSFAVDHGQGNFVLEESWRRTWWELYVIDSLFAGIRHWPTFSLWKVETDAYLPAEEEFYFLGIIPQPRTLCEYDDRCFQEDDNPFSSFTYLIDAARILGTTLAAGDIAGGSPSSLVKNAEANIMSWDLYLPHCKRDPVRSDGTVDEVLFRAHLMINTVAIHLHRPRSALNHSTMELLCSKYAPPLPAEVIPTEEKHPDRHTHKAIRAAKTFVDLLSVPSPPTMHTPFVMCMGSLAVATHLSACEYRLMGSEFSHARDRVRVFLGILRAFKDVWPQAEKWGQEIRMMARVVFEGRDTGGQLVPGRGVAEEAVASGTPVGEESVGMELWRIDGTMEDILGNVGIVT